MREDSGAGRGRSVDDVLRELRRVQAAPVGGRSRPDHRGPRAARGGRHRSGSVGAGRRWRRRAGAALVLLGVVVAGRSAWTAVPGPGPGPAATSPAAPEQTWPEVLRSLDAARVAAWSALDERALAGVDVAGSVAERSDRDAVRALRARGVRPDGLRFDVGVVGVVDRAAGSVRLRVVDARSAYALVGHDGVVTARVAARPRAAWQVELRMTAAGWRVAAVRPLR